MNGDKFHGWATLSAAAVVPYIHTHTHTYTHSFGASQTICAHLWHEMPAFAARCSLPTANCQLRLLGVPANSLLLTAARFLLGDCVALAVAAAAAATVSVAVAVPLLFSDCWLLQFVSLGVVAIECQLATVVDAFIGRIWKIFSARRVVRVTCNECCSTKQSIHTNIYVT